MDTGIIREEAPVSSAGIASVTQLLALEEQEADKLEVDPGP